MNIFLHQLDVKIQAFMNQEKNLYYVRYADDMIFAIKKGENSEKRNQNFQKCFQNALDKLQLEATSFSFIRGKSHPCGTLVLGLLVSINLKGNLEISAPLNRWKKKFTLAYPQKWGRKKRMKHSRF